MIVECIEPACIELTEHPSCLCEDHKKKVSMQCRGIGLFLKLVKPGKPQRMEHV